MAKEFTEKQLEQIERIYTATYELIKVMVGDENHEYKMEEIGEVAELCADVLTCAKSKVYFPWEDSNGNVYDHYHDFNIEEGTEAEKPTKPKNYKAILNIAMAIETKVKNTELLTKLQLEKQLAEKLMWQIDATKTIKLGGWTGEEYEVSGGDCRWVMLLNDDND